MNATESCPRCGSPKFPAAMEGLCPACLLASGLRALHEGLAGTVMPPASCPGGNPIVLGDYELLDEIARGGMGIVFKARQRSLNRIVAVKMLQAGHFASAEQVRRFRAEAEATARLQHPNIVAIHDIGEHERQPFFSMDFVAGQSLAALVRGVPLSPQRASRYVRIVSLAVSCAHAHGILHRDLKPSNVLIDDDDQPRLTDFGLAKFLNVTADATLAGTVVGSPGYLPPEQASGSTGAVSERSDVYSLGAVLYELLVGHPPFQAANAAETMRLVLDTQPVRPRRLNPSVPRDLETICLKCLEKSPDRRYASARELADELSRFERQEPIRARPVPRLEKGWRWCRRNPALAGSIAAVALLLVTVAAGTTVASVKLARAEKATEEKLRLAYLEQARATRLTGVAGRRSNSLAAVRAAARIKPSLELRNEAIASLALVDLGEPITWQSRSTHVDSQPARFDADLQRYAVAQARGEISVHRADNHQEIASFHGPAARMVDVIFSADGSWLAGHFTGGSVLVWQLNGSRSHTNLPMARAHKPHAICFDSVGATFAIADDQQRVWSIDLGTGVADSEPLSVGKAISRIELAPGAAIIAVTTGREVGLWHTHKRERIQSLAHGSEVTAMAWHPQSRHLSAGCANGELWLWNIHTGERIPLPGYSAPISSVAFSHRGDLLATHAWDSHSRFWDATTGRHLFSTHDILARRFSRNDEQLFYSQEGSDVGVLRVERSSAFRTVASAYLKHPQLSGVSFTADGKWLACGEFGGNWHLWDVAAGKEIATAAWPPRAYTVLEPQGRAVFVVNDDTVLRYALKPRRGSDSVEVARAEVLLRAPGTNLEFARLSTDGQTLIVTGGHRSFAIPVHAPERHIAFARESPAIQGDISPDKRWLVTASFRGSGVNVWNGATGAFERRLVTNENAQVAFNPHGHMLITKTAREYCFWDTRTWEVRHRTSLSLAGGVGGPVAVSTDGKLLATMVTRSGIKLVDTHTTRELATLTAAGAEHISGLAFGGNNRFLAASTQNRLIQLWDLATLRRELAEMNLDW